MSLFAFYERIGLCPKVPVISISLSLSLSLTQTLRHLHTQAQAHPFSHTHTPFSHPVIPFSANSCPRNEIKVDPGNNDFFIFTLMTVTTIAATTTPTATTSVKQPQCLCLSLVLCSMPTWKQFQLAGLTGILLSKNHAYHSCFICLMTILRSLQSSKILRKPSLFERCSTHLNLLA